MKIMLIGLGPHARRIYIKLLKEHKIEPTLVVDLESKEKEVKEFIKKQSSWENTYFYFLQDKDRNVLDLPRKAEKELSEIIKKEKITHAIISTEPKAHFAYAKFLLENNINILLDKPITAPIDVINNYNQATRIRTEYETLCEMYKMAKVLHPNQIFSIQCQRRFHKGYKYIKDLLDEMIIRYNIPISYIDIYHSDGMWNMPDEFIYRENHPYKYGYGKLFHSGYHFIDLLTWLLDANNKLLDKKIKKASIYSESYRPSDFAYNFNSDDYKNFFNSEKFDDILKDDNIYDNYGEIDYHSFINFYSKNNKLITTCSMNLLQSGFSRRAWIELPEDTYKGNGRVRHERLNIQIGPIMNIQVHSYQAYEVKERKKQGGDNVGDLEHFDIYIFRNTELIGGQPFEKIKLSELYDIKDKRQFIGYNEKARESCFMDFINNRDNQSNILLHKQSIKLLEKAYKSLIYGGKKMKFNFDLEEHKCIDNIVCITDKDFQIEEIKHDKEPKIRFGSRGIVLNDKGQIAIIYKENKNEYKLPGGGIEKKEDAEEAFKRECEEEIAAKVNMIKLLGTAEEYKSQENFKQLSFVFVAEKIKDLEEVKLTEKEKAEGTKFLWLDKLEALEKMNKSLEELKGSKYDNAYRTRFMVLRDIKILEYYINKTK